MHSAGLHKSCTLPVPTPLPSQVLYIAKLVMSIVLLARSTALVRCATRQACYHRIESVSASLAEAQVLGWLSAELWDCRQPAACALVISAEASVPVLHSVPWQKYCDLQVATLVKCAFSPMCSMGLNPRSSQPSRLHHQHRMCLLCLVPGTSCDLLKWKYCQECAPLCGPIHHSSNLP